MADEQNLSGASVPGSPLKAEISFDSAGFSPTTTPQTRSSELSPGSSSIPDTKSHKKPRTTAVWKHFTDRRSISDTHWEVKCVNCETFYRIKKDGSTGTSTLHKHHKQCSDKMARTDGSPAPRQQHHTPTPGPDFRSHDYSSSASHEASPSTHTPTSPAQQSHHSLVSSYSAQALQDFLRAAHQNTEQQGGPPGSGLGPGDFDMAAAAAAASMAYGTGDGTHDPQSGQHHQQQQQPSQHQQHQQQIQLHQPPPPQQQQHPHPHPQHHSHLQQHIPTASVSETLDILVLNPNSSDSITVNLRSLLESNRAPGVKYTYMTGPPSAPPSINDPPTSILSAQSCFEMLASQHIPPTKSGILVCCFSAHPLVPMLRHQWPSVPVMHILDASINHAMSCGANTFGIITTGKAMIPDIDAGVRSYIGGVSDRYRGCIATGLGVLELGDVTMKDHVERVIKEQSGRLAVEKGAEAIILGCAGMAGMESIVKQGVLEAGGSPEKIWVVDGAKAGVQILHGLARCRYGDV